ncbi:NADPH-dependent FMN reductase [Spongiimicrobium sp. 3-5]|uniref:NADPH-dependent FMN reductase n=1 Tax=Spongiimicrobium sp. 3-5 TaxID=3332596 RepID=UPI00397FC9C8
MITIISGSNRKNNKTVHFAKHVCDRLSEQVETEVRFLDLSDLDTNMVSETMYKDSEQPEIIRYVQDTYFIPSTKLWFFVPEYNGSYPGILKLILDSMSVRDYDISFGGKKACITGIASGRAGNLRGMDHLADVLNHLGMYVHPNKNPISSIYKELSKESNTLSEDAMKSLQKQIDQFLGF